MSFQPIRTTEQKLNEQKFAEKLSDIAVVSLMPPGSSHQSSSSGTTTTTSGRQDYDNSATTADEGQGGTNLDNGSVVVTLTTSNGNTTSLQQNQQQIQHTQPSPIVHSRPSTTSNFNPLTVKDLMFGVIEMQLKRTPNSPADGGGSSATNSSGTPTISSILKTYRHNSINDNDICFTGSY